MDQDYKKIWLITGVSSGLGLALAEEVMAQGDFVIGTLRKQEQVEEFNKRYSKKGVAIKIDLTQSKEIDQALNLIKEEFPGIDVLVNNAGIGFVGAVEEATINEVNKVFAVNVMGTLEITQKILPIFRSQKRGHIIQISSHSGFKGMAGFGIYNASKFALEGFSEALVAEVEPLGIKLTIVEPGPFRTNFAGTSLIAAARVIEDYNNTAGVFRDRLKNVNGKQEGDPAKAAKAIVQIAKLEKPPLRLPLGKIALATITSKLESVQKDLNEWQDVARNAVFDE